MHHLSISEEWHFRHSVLTLRGNPIFAVRSLTLLEMLFDCNIIEVVRLNEHLTNLANTNDWNAETPLQLSDYFKASTKKLGKLYLPSTITGMRHYLSLGDPAIPEYNATWLRRNQREICEDIIRRIHEDLRLYTFVALEQSEARNCNQRMYFGPDVQKKFPDLADDIREAGNCFAFGRYGASAYYVSIIMENAARRLARRVGLTPPKGKRIADLGWQNLADMITAELKIRPRSTSRQKAINEGLSEANNHLWNVKEAYRNRIAHGRIKPSKRRKDWRTEEVRLAYVLLTQTDQFMQFLTRMVS